MERPYIICHMMTSLDGKIIGDFMSEEKTEYFYEQYGQIMDNYADSAGMIGRVTLQEMGISEFDARIKDLPDMFRMDYVANKDSTKYTIAVDPSGRLGWTKERIEEGKESGGEHIIEIITEKVSDAYLSHLQRLGISYIFGGRDKLDFNLVMKKLKDLFSIKQILVVGGGTLNGLLLNEGLIDEISLLLMPFADGAAHSKTIFEIKSENKKMKSVSFDLSSYEKLDNSGLWLRYTVKSE